MAEVNDPIYFDLVREHYGLTPEMEALYQSVKDTSKNKPVPDLWPFHEPLNKDQ